MDELRHLPGIQNRGLPDWTQTSGALVVPVHNEQEEVAAFIDSAFREIPEVPVVLVFDRCTDGSFAVSQAVCRRHPRHPVFSQILTENPYGKAGACLTGLWVLLQMGAPFHLPVLFWDSDNEYGLEAARVRRLLAHVRNTGGLASARREGARLLRSRLAQGAVRAGLRLFQRRAPPDDVLTAVHALPLRNMLLAMNGARSFDMETRLVAYSLRHKLPLWEDTVSYTPRIEGKKIRAWHLFRILLASTGWL